MTSTPSREKAEGLPPQSTRCPAAGGSWRHGLEHAARRLPRHVGLGLVVSLCFVPGVVYGQPAKEVNQQYQFWASVNSTTRVTDRLGAIADVHVRRNDFLADPSFNLLRFGAHYWVSDRLPGEPRVRAHVASAHLRRLRDVGR